MLEKGYLIRPF